MYKARGLPQNICNQLHIRDSHMKLMCILEIVVDNIFKLLI